jgi:hypothetical protein
MPQPHTFVGNWYEWLNWHNHVSSMRLCELSETQSRVHWAPIFFRPRRKKMRSGPCPWYKKGLQSKLQRVKRCLHRITIAFQCQGPICWRQRGSRRSTFEDTNSKASSSCRTNFRGQCISLFLNHAHQN